MLFILSHNLSHQIYLFTLIRARKEKIVLFIQLMLM